MGRERRLRDWARSNAAGFHADFGNGDVNNVSHFVSRFTFNLYSAVFLAANPVSYTHLDVYKRQRGRWWRWQRGLRNEFVGH